MTDHEHATHGCGHNHGPNPYAIDQNEAAGLTELMMQLHRCMALGVHVDPHTAGKFAVMCAVGATTGARDLSLTIKALMWELADLTQVMTHGKQLVTEQRLCDDPDHDHSSDQEQADQEFGFTTMEAFFDAATRGDLQGAVNVVDAVMADGTLGDGDPEFAATVVFANAMVSTAMTIRNAVHGDAMYLFTP